MVQRWRGANAECHLLRRSQRRHGQSTACLAGSLSCLLLIEFMYRPSPLPAAV